MYSNVIDMREINLIAHNIRSCHNVGSLLRTADGLGAYVYLTGYTPYPTGPLDKRLPHEAKKIHKQIHKTALGAEELPIWQQHDNIYALLEELKRQGFLVAALEQTPHSDSLPSFKPTDRIALLLGEERSGIKPELLEICEKQLEIPMFGSKESLNVTQAAAMALYHCRFHPE